MLSALTSKFKSIVGDTNSSLEVNETGLDIVVLEVIWP